MTDLPMNTTATDVRWPRFRALGVVAVFAVIYAVAFVIGDGFGTLNADTSWLIHVAHRVLGGEALYVEVWDTNPPFSVLLYVPMAALENVSGLRAELWTVAAVFGWLSASLWLCNRILVLAGSATAQASLALLAFLAATVLWLMPSQFAQREQFGIIGALPLLLLYASWSSLRDTPHALTSGLAGAMAAVLLLVKPQYAIGYLLPIIWLMWVHRDWRLLIMPAHWAGFVVCALYAASVVIVFPDFLRSVLPLVVEFYVPMRRSLAELLELSVFALLVIVVAALVLRRFYVGVPNATAVFALAGLGFLSVYFLNGKGWTYHLLPALVCLLAALAVSVLGRWSQERPQITAMAVPPVALMAMIAVIWTPNETMKVPEPVIAAGPGLEMITVTTDISVGNPLARNLELVWRERENSDLLATLALLRLKSEASQSTERLTALVDGAVARKLDRLQSGDVDLILFDHGSSLWIEHLLESPAIRGELYRFASVGCSGAVEFLLNTETAPQEILGAALSKGVQGCDAAP